MSSAFIGIIDGTGPYEDAEYASEMKNSFCSQIGAFHSLKSVYLRGPSGDGIYIERRAHEIADAVMRERASETYLAGYSRGGSIAVIAAGLLAERGIAVKALFLFDPVARHFSASSDEIPGNVASVYAARRIIRAKEMDAYDYKLLGSAAGHNPVRNWFGTTATRFASKDTYRDERTFLGSHGALGGVGWRDVREDSTCQIDVAKFFNEALAREGLPSGLTSFPPSSLF